MNKSIMVDTKKNHNYIRIFVKILKLHVLTAVVILHVLIDSFCNTENISYNLWWMISVTFARSHDIPFSALLISKGWLVTVL